MSDHGSPRAWWAMAALIVVLGAAAVATQLALNALRESLIDADVAQLRAIGDIQAGVTDSHLWMEEFVTGDSVTHAEIWSGIDKSRALASALLDGGARTPGGYAVRAVREPQLREGIGALSAEVAHFATIATQRESDYRRGAKVGVGSPSDAEHDKAFHALIAHAQQLRARIERRMDESLDRARLLARATIGAWLALVALALAGSARLERRRRAAEQSLREGQLRLAESRRLESLGRLAGGLAHDINNYLAAISAQSELVRRKPPSCADAVDSARLRQRMDAIVATADRAAGLIRRLLAFSREEGAQREALDIDRLVTELEPLMRQLVGDTVTLALRLDARGALVEADPAQLEQVLVNLIVNAREATEARGRVDVSTRRATLPDGEEGAARLGLRPGEYVALAVADDGAGIPADVRERIFDPFFSTRPRTSNSGLGLATVYGIVQRHEGAIGVASEPGRGTRMTVFLPLRRAGCAIRERET